MLLLFARDVGFVVAKDGGVQDKSESLGGIKTAYPSVAYRDVYRADAVVIRPICRELPSLSSV